MWCVHSIPQIYPSHYQIIQPHTITTAQTLFFPMREGTMSCLLHYIITFFFYFCNFDWLVYQVKCSNVLTTSVLIYRRYNFVYHHYGYNCTWIYQPFSDPFRSLFFPLTLLTLLNSAWYLIDAWMCLWEYAEVTTHQMMYFSIKLL